MPTSFQRQTPLEALSIHRKNTPFYGSATSSFTGSTLLVREKGNSNDRHDEPYSSNAPPRRYAPIAAAVKKRSEVVGIPAIVSGSPGSSGDAAEGISSVSGESSIGSPVVASIVSGGAAAAAGVTTCETKAK